MKFAAVASLSVCCLVYIITTLVTLYCASGKDKTCAKNSGILAAFTSFFALAMIGLGVFVNRSGHAP